MQNIHIIPQEDPCSFCKGTGQIVSSTTISGFKTCDCINIPQEEPKQDITRTMKTAVEWYKQELNKIELSYMNKVIDRIVYMDLKSQAFEQAKEMEKEQINEAFYDGYYKEELYDSRKYYNETFKSE